MLAGAPQLQNSGLLGDRRRFARLQQIVTSLTARAQASLPQAFADIGADHENRVLILTGTGNAWCDATDGRGWENNGTPRGGSCTIAGTGLTAAGEPRMGLN